MPLIFEIWDDKRGAWKEANQLIPGDPMASLTNHTIIGGRELYLLGCEPDDRTSTIYQSLMGVDIDLSSALRDVMVEHGQLRVVKRLGDGESYEMSMMTDRMLVSSKIRLRHVKIDFGTRHCLICGQEIPAQRFGAHVMETHSPEEWPQWPGGVVGFLACLRRSLVESVKCAKGFPKLQARLKVSLKTVNDLEKRLKAGQN